MIAIDSNRPDKNTILRVQSHRWMIVIFQLKAKKQLLNMFLHYPKSKKTHFSPYTLEPNYRFTHTNIHLPSHGQAFIPMKCYYETASVALNFKIPTLCSLFFGNFAPSAYSHEQIVGRCVKWYAPLTFLHKKQINWLLIIWRCSLEVY